MNQVYMLITTEFGKKRTVSNKLLKFKEIKNVHELYGQYDIIITIKGKNLREIEEFIQKNIRTIKEIQRTETLVVSDVPTG